MKRETNKVTTPIADFVQDYAKRGGHRLHMPGHKGKGTFGWEIFDITEIDGADALYEADGIIRESEEQAARLFHARKTCFSTEGSSQCIRAMLYLALLRRKPGIRPVVIAGRNAHKAFVYAAALLDFDVIWLWPEEDDRSICSCRISPVNLDAVLEEHPEAVAVYLTSPDYLGMQCDIEALARVCHKRDTILAVDNAHGAYLHYLEKPCHPMDLGADLCCDSAHKTLPVLTGGAYLHIGWDAPHEFAEQAKYAMELFGSTSPSYLILTSLDLCNSYLAMDYREKLKDVLELCNQCKIRLTELEWNVKESDPLKITIEIPKEISKEELRSRLKSHLVEPEYIDPDYLVFMVTPENTKEDIFSIAKALKKPSSFSNCIRRDAPKIALSRPVVKLSIREATLLPSDKIPAKMALGRICKAPSISCPPAISIGVPGEVIDEDMIETFQYYGMTQVDVVRTFRKSFDF